MILIKITKENREPEVGEWYYYTQLDAVGQRTPFGKLSGGWQRDCKALSLSVILDAPEKWDNPYWKIYDEPTLDHSPISNSEEIFQWLHDQGKLGEEWVEWEGDFVLVDERDDVVRACLIDRIFDNPPDDLWDLH